MAPRSENSLSEHARQLLSAERSSVESSRLKERAAARARRALEDGRGSLGRRRVAAERPAWGGRARGPALLGAAALALAGLAAAGARLSSAPEVAVPVSHVVKPSRPSPTLPLPSTPAKTAEVATPPPSAEPRSARVPPLRVRGQTASPSASSESAPSSARQYAIELQLLEPARSGVARGDFAGALAAVLRHRREFPGGQLAEERSALQVRALWGLGRISEAEAAAAAFRQRYPRSALLSWMPARRAPSP
jgi:hypothetical protein